MPCASCTAPNPVDAGFCASCGAPLAPAPGAERSAPTPPPPQQAAPAAPLAAAPIVHVAPQGGAAPGRITCDRCRGTSSGDMSYCRFCGARLGAPRAPAAPAPAPPPVAAVAAVDEQRSAANNPEPLRLPEPPAFAQGVGVTTNLYAPPPEPALPAARLVVIAQDGSPGREYSLSEPQTDIGREEGPILLPNDPFVSPRHARITQRNGRFWVTDLGSVNGVFVRLREPRKLEHADLVLIGLEVLRFETVSDAEKGLGPAFERGTQLFGAPAARRFARLCERTVEGVTRDVYYLGRDETVIGREAGDIVFTADPFMSRRHAIFTRDPSTGSFTLRDLGSSNGTYLAIRSEQELRHGDHVRIGQHLFRLDVEAGGAPHR